MPKLAGFVEIVRKTIRFLPPNARKHRRLITRLDNSVFKIVCLAFIKHWQYFDCLNQLWWKASFHRESNGSASFQD